VVTEQKIHKMETNFLNKNIHTDKNHRFSALFRQRKLSFCWFVTCTVCL